MNNKKAKELRRIYNSNPHLQDFMTFKAYKKVYLKNIEKGSRALQIIRSRQDGMAR